VRSEIEDKGAAERNPIRGILVCCCASATSGAEKRLTIKLVRRAVPFTFIDHLRMAGCYAGGRATSISEGQLPVQMQLAFLTPWIARF
jgi:hypothetical protein